MDTQEFIWTEDLIKEFIFKECNKYNTWDESGIYEWLKKFKEDKIRSKYKWIVFTVDGFAYPKWKVIDWTNGSMEVWSESIKAFKTEQEAKDFIIDNKPCLSKKECEDICTEWLGKRQDSFGTNLLYYIKEKLGL